MSVKQRLSALQSDRRAIPLPPPTPKAPYDPDASLTTEERTTRAIENIQSDLRVMVARAAERDVKLDEILSVVRGLAVTLVEHDVRLEKAEKRSESNSKRLGRIEKHLLLNGKEA